jgi:ABC-type branched-subunit amino acid transport system ATPase component
MKLTFSKKLKSITSFEEVDNLPDFVLVTGVNGVGKSHLLEAISNGRIRINDGFNKDKISLFSNATLVPGQGATLKINNSEIHSYLIGLIGKQRPKASEIVKSSGLLSNITFSPDDDVLTIFDYDTPHIQSHYEGYGVEFNDQTKLGLDTLKVVVDKNFADHLVSVISKINTDKSNTPKSNFPIDKAKLKEIVRDIDFIKCNTDSIRMKIEEVFNESIFTQNFSKLFKTYKTKEIYNTLHRDHFKSGNFLSEDEFIIKNGRPPWDIVDDIIKIAKLDFKVSKPIEFDYQDFMDNLMTNNGAVKIDYTFCLVPEDPSIRITPEGLSSGEKVLLSFALCLFNLDEEEKLSVRPEFLLFDEVDASLHPQMSQHLIDVITKELVKKENIKVIMTTHSPSTVAIAPEDSIYVMRKGQGLEKAKRQNAVNLLTEHIPTLSINNDGRRQVFVESKYDAECYEYIYNLLINKLGSELSLNFIPAGLSGTGGRDAVKMIVNNLSGNGVETVHGIIDWDGTNKPEEHIHILAENERYTLDNCILDPLLVAATVIKIDDKIVTDLGLKVDTSYTDLKDLDQDDLQKLSDVVVKKVIGKGNETGSMKQKYNGDFEININKEYLHKKGCDLTKDIISTFLCLSGYEDNPKKLLNDVSSTIMKDHRNFIPTSFFGIFEKILQVG